MRAISVISAAGLMATAIPLLAAETITYSYDAKGRVVKVVRIGTVNNNVTYDYTHDRANNRSHVKVTNSPNPPSP
jgi:hypothetical protein